MYFVAYTNRFLSVWNVQIWSLSETNFCLGTVKFRPAHVSKKKHDTSHIVFFKWCGDVIWWCDVGWWSGLVMWCGWVMWLGDVMWFGVMWFGDIMWFAFLAFLAFLWEIPPYEKFLLIMILIIIPPYDKFLLMKIDEKIEFCRIYQSIPLGLKRADMKSLWNFFLPLDLVKFRPADYYLFGPMGHSSFLVISQVFKIPTHDLAHLYTVIRCVWHENFVKIHQKLSELLDLQTAFFTLHGLLGILHLVRKPFGRVFLKTRIFKSHLSNLPGL